MAVGCRCATLWRVKRLSSSPSSRSPGSAPRALRAHRSASRIGRKWRRRRPTRLRPARRRFRPCRSAIRELAADVLFVRLGGYFGGDHNTAGWHRVAGRGDRRTRPEVPSRLRATGARAMEHTRDLPGSATRSTTLSDRRARYRNEGVPGRLEAASTSRAEIYTQDLQTDDPAKRREWDEKGTLLAESSVRKPRRTAGAATWAATMRAPRLGQHERAAAGLKEMLLATNDPFDDPRPVDRQARRHSTTPTPPRDHGRDLRAAPQVRTGVARRPPHPASDDGHPGLGPHPRPGFDLGDLATGGRDLSGTDEVEKLPPVD